MSPSRRIRILCHLSEGTLIWVSSALRNGFCALGWHSYRLALRALCSGRFRSFHGGISKKEKSLKKPSRFLASPRFCRTKKVLFPLSRLLHREAASGIRVFLENQIWLHWNSWIDRGWHVLCGRFLYFLMMSHKVKTINLVAAASLGRWSQYFEYFVQLCV